ncbi:hypothetical protein E5288_WYG004724 [Bos mutus]|uniref:Uncharacterized protein n=1 Tax=Bos mutus TaxID=72004 RepID=A0A6B0SJ51_9CETA|nr:hypothetical protein [Bos mutus]
MENISPGQIIDEPIRPVNIPRKEKDFQGMLEYKKEDEQKLVKNLILGKYFERSFWCVSVVGEISHSFISHTGFFSQPCVLCAVLPQHSDPIMAVSHPTRTPARTAC